MSVCQERRPDNIRQGPLLTDADHFRIMEKPASLRSETDRRQRGIVIGIPEEYATKLGGYTRLSTVPAPAPGAAATSARGNLTDVLESAMPHFKYWGFR